IERARRLAQEAFAYATGMGHLATVAYALVVNCDFELLCRDMRRLLPYAQSLVAMSREHGLAFYLARSTFLLGYAHWQAGKKEAGTTEMRDGIRMMREQGITYKLPLFEACRAEAEAEMGRVESALAMLDDAFALSERTGQHCHDAELHRVRGDILLRADR